MRRSASPNAPCSAASAHHDDDEARPPGEIGDRDRDRTRAADNHLRPWQYRLDEDVHRALARAHIVGETHALLLLARFHAAVGEHVGRLHRDEPRASVGERVLRGPEHCRASATAADPAFRDGAVRQDHRLGAGLGRGRRHRAHDGCEHERLAGRSARRNDVENVIGAGHDQILARYGSSAARLCRLWAGANKST
jgi:hypothetical protein